MIPKRRPVVDQALLHLATIGVAVLDGPDSTARRAEQRTAPSAAASRDPCTDCRGGGSGTFSLIARSMTLPDSAAVRVRALRVGVRLSMQQPLHERRAAVAAIATKGDVGQLAEPGLLLDPALGHGERGDVDGGQKAVGGRCASRAVARRRRAAGTVPVARWVRRRPCGCRRGRLSGRRSPGCSRPAGRRCHTQ